MGASEVIMLLVGCFVVLPITAYMVGKFGAAGYFRAKRRDQKQRKTTACQSQKTE